jgi:hypothetical protein
VLVRRPTAFRCDARQEVAGPTASGSSLPHRRLLEVTAEGSLCGNRSANADAGTSSVLPVTDGVVRRAQGSDVQAMVELREHMFAAMGVTSPDPTWRKNAHEWFSSRLGLTTRTITSRSLRLTGLWSPVPSGLFVMQLLHRQRPRGATCWWITGARLRRSVAAATAVWPLTPSWCGPANSASGRAELMATAVGRGMYERAGICDTSFPAMRARLF